MRRSELEHAIRAAGDIAADTELIVIGSQAILGSFPNAHRDLVQSLEVDLFPRNHPERSDLIDGAIGELSPFHHTFGYYVHGVGPETATLPAGWERRLVRVKNANTGGCTAWCLEPHDLAASKLAASRERDYDFVRAMLRHRYVEPARLRRRIGRLPIPAARRERLLAWLKGAVSPGR
jgi:hypothetical protein